MAWKGNNVATPNSDKTLSVQPNNKQNSQAYSNTAASEWVSRDTGEVIRIHEPVGGIPKIGPYKKVNAIRRDLDLTKDFKIDILDIDTTIIEYLDKRLNLVIIDNDELIKVPIIYASPERWYSVKKDGCLRDNQGKIILPLLLINRTNIQNDTDLITFNRYLNYIIKTKYDIKNKYDRFNLLTNRTKSGSKPVNQIFKVKLPDYVIISYDCIIWTDYVSQSNELIEKINYATHDYWGLDRFRFRTKISNYQIEINVDSGADRNVKTSFKLDVNAYLLPDTIDGVKSTTQKDITYRKIILTESTTNNIKNKKNNPYSYLKKYL